MAARPPQNDRLADDDDDLLDPHNPYASATRWRHEESSSFRRHAGGPREPAIKSGSKSGTSDLANFLNSTRISPGETSDGAGDTAASGGKFKPIVIDGDKARAAGEPDPHPDETTRIEAAPQDGKTVACGPLLNYRRMEGHRWIGSVLVVTKGGGKTQPFVPTLLLRKVSLRETEPAIVDSQIAEDGHVSGLEATDNAGAGAGYAPGSTEVRGLCLSSDPRNTFWRFDLSVEMEDTETKWEYRLPGLRFHVKTKPQVNYFFVPAITESMRVLFFSCNGFSVGTDEEAYSGAALWNDVIRRHAEDDHHFHLAVAGGDQCYCDGIRVEGPLRQWTEIANPKKRREYPFSQALRAACDDYYLKNYIRWYNREPFATANGQIPHLNIWDDHDIIDGFGSYVDEFMRCPVFRGIGGTAHKYYMLFQHHLPPPASTYTSDAPQTVTEPGDHAEAGIDHDQLINRYVAEPILEPNYIIGREPGPYVAEHSHNIFTKVGARMCLVGIDARTERTRHQVNYPETYDLIFNRLEQELSDAAKAGTPYNHVLLLLGIPIAYPRLTWLENIFTSPVMGPIKFVNRRFGVGGGLFNHFDGSVDLLDDLDDHYTARTHKKERNQLVERLQSVSAKHSVRITILGGDVHLAALGRFYSNPSLLVATDNDPRYMVNVVSSAIVNKPPPQAIANLLARRNKIHHLNTQTDETLLKLFDKDPGESSKTASHNNVTMPSRNFAMITENSPNNRARPATLAPPPTFATNGDANHLAPPGSSAGASTAGGASIATSRRSGRSRRSARGTDGHSTLGDGETNAGTKHKAASMAEHGRGSDGGLDICICVEIDQHDKEGHTEGYGLTVPTLRCRVEQMPPPGPAVSAVHAATAPAGPAGAVPAVEHAAAA
ncbi:Transcription factor [Pleurostoma richardsiae]|uniref:Transcription factor n=1 Tax=Pleurostoma richardsiae TaxID=41990 RepID=A0AA38SFY5_9PEZI|nr:Transcription factor [Pleurostoma richardsiae]